MKWWGWLPLKAKQIFKIIFTFSDLSLDGVVVILGTLGEDVFDAAGLARVKKSVAMKVVRLKEFDPEKM